MSSCRLLVDFHTSTVETPGEQGEIDMLSGVDVFFFFWLDQTLPLWLRLVRGSVEQISSTQLRGATPGRDPGTLSEYRLLWHRYDEDRCCGDSTELWTVTTGWRAVLPSCVGTGQ